ncbi:MAG: DUF1279 domain-containing protein [Deltaproteobacteria bacterium]
MDSTPESPTAASVAKLPLSERMKALALEYGAIGLCVFLSTFLLTISGVFLALQFGMKVGGATENAGTLGGTLLAAYLITLATKPVRIAITLAVTPAVALVLRRFRKPAATPPAVSPSNGPPSAVGGQGQK